MDRELAKELKAAGFPIAAYRAGHTFYPPEQGGGWGDTARQHGVTVTRYDLEDRMQDLKDGYYCPDLSDLIEACGPSFSRLFVEADIWTAESKEPAHIIHARAADEAVTKLWLTLNKAR